MDSHELIGRSGGNRWIPLVAVVQDDFRQIIRHWAYLIWAGLAVVLPILWMMNVSSLSAGSLVGLMRQMGTHEVAKPNSELGLAANSVGDDESSTHVVGKPQENAYVPMDQDYAAQRRAKELAARPYQDEGQSDSPRRYSSASAAPVVAGTASQLGAKLLGMHLLVWIGLAMSLGASAISSEAVSVGESVMCWGVSRWQYFLGKMASRSLASMALVAILTLPMLLVFNSKATGDLAFWPSIQTTLVCTCIVGCVVAAGVAAGAWFRTSMRAVGVSLIALVVFGATCTFLAPTAYSPMAFVANLPYALRGLETAAVSSVLSLAAWTAGGLTIVSMGKFMWADL